jgi:hypothetical protein
VRIRVVRRHTKTVGPRMTGKFGSDHESITLTCVLLIAGSGAANFLELTPDLYPSGSTPHLILGHYIAKRAF